jgi:voltage-gated potassium channel
VSSTAERHACYAASGVNFRYLFVGLVAWLLIQPIGDVLLGPYDDRVLGMMLGLLLLLGLWSIGMPLRVFRFGEVLVTTVIVIAVVTAVWPNTALQTVGSLLATLYLLTSAVIAFRHLFSHGAITTNHLLGAMTVYLLIGISWALMLGVTDRLLPGAFRGATTNDLGDFVYLSFVTLATLGFGDIVPVHPVARTLVYVEAVAGQFYVAILVANLVGRYVAAARED